MIEVYLLIGTTIIITSIGTLLLKVGVCQIQTQRIKSMKEFILFLFKLIINKKWFLGGLFYILGWILMMVVFQIADLSFAKPFLTSGNIFLIMILSRKFLKENIRKPTLISLLVITSGIFLLGFVPEVTKTSTINPDDITWFFVVWIFILIALAISSYFFKNRKIKIGIFSIFNGIVFGFGTIFQNLLAQKFNTISILSLEFWFSLLMDFYFYMIICSTVLGFIFMQYLLIEGHVSICYSLGSALTNIVIFTGAAFIFKEELNFFLFSTTAVIRVLSFLLITIGVSATQFFYSKDNEGLSYIAQM